MKEKEIKNKVTEYLIAISATSMVGKKNYSEEELIEYCCAVADYFLNLKKEKK